MLRRFGSSAKLFAAVNEKRRGHFGGFGTMSETSRTPLAFSTPALLSMAACAVAMSASSAPAPVPIGAYSHLEL